MTTPILAAVLRPGMTLGEAKAAFASCWPYLALKFYEPTAAYYKEDERAGDCQTRDDDALRAHGPTGRPTERPVLLTGGLSRGQVRDLIYNAFGLETGIEYFDRPAILPGGTLHEYHENAVLWEKRFKAFHGRAPGIRDQFNNPRLVG